MLFYKEDKNFLSQIQKQKWENLLNNFSFPFYLDDAKADFPNQYTYLSHILLHRSQDQKPFLGSFNSEHAPYFVSLLHSFCKKNNIVVAKIHRMAINLTFNLGKIKPHIHTDHEHDYYHLLIYLNDCDPKACTIILNKKKKIIKRIQPEKYKGVCFNKHYHYHLYPKKGCRIVAVYTLS
jgi:hypothetical protein